MTHQDQIAITLDVSSIPYGRGVSRYTSNLVRALSLRPDVSLGIFGYSRAHFDQLQAWSEELPSFVRKKIWKVPPTWLHASWRLLSLPPLSWIDPQAQVFHAWDWQLAPLGSIPQVVTIHDLAYKLFPDTAHSAVVRQYDQLLQTLENHPKIPVIAVSQATKNDIVNLTNIDPQRVHVVYEALPEEAKIIPSEEERSAVLVQAKLHKPFLLTVGTTEPRKNLQRVIEAWKKISDRYDLVIAGAQGWDNLEKHPGIHYLGYVSPVTLASLYRSAHALVFVSLYEGFGLPILEAYFQHCPVVTANVSSMSEIADKPGILVDPYDVDMIAEACLAVEPPDSAARKKRIKDMQTVLNRFTWEATAEQTVQVYKQARGQAT